MKAKNPAFYSQCDCNFREGSQTPSDRNERIGRQDNNRIPCMTLTRTDDEVKVLVPVPGVGHNTNR